ncbi:MAG TPA: hypothetical protein VIA62_07665 [Thermoanaerobaculia bacterium]|jgi:photosystem II stability/assembly factor-like uncharacterized protein|nr:hypothetical protein [Thermoanaerobaculia bacterium]
MPRSAVLGLILVLISSSGWAAGSAIDPARLAGLAVRSIGPAGMSGRVAAVEGVESDPDVLYIGGAGGGIWKTVNGGASWEPVFDRSDRSAAQPALPIGAIAVFQANPEIVWAGTGEGNLHHSALSGDGVYRSLDGGRTWKHLGLDGTGHIARIVLHPANPDVAWVAALGSMWTENPERGVFKTVDGGKTWSKVLFVDAKTGAADLAIDPRNPGKLYAAMWQYRRWPWIFRSGGPGSGLYVSLDGGGTWTRRTADDGLPEGELGRIKLAVSRSHPEVVYAMVEAATSALLRSDDGGASFRTVNASPNLHLRPFYFPGLAVDPQWPNRVYDLDMSLHVSDDNGRTFRDLLAGQGVHPDLHAIWIDPGDPRHLVLATDGGVFVSRDRGRRAVFLSNLPLSQFYRIAVDQAVPFNVYGGLQDNGSYRGPSDAWEAGGIQDHSWTLIGLSDGSTTVPDPADPDRGYALSQNGGLQRWDLKTGEIKDMPPADSPGAHLRYNFTGGFALDPFAPGTLYLGSQYVHKSTDRGDTWTVISPDLTTNNPDWQHQAESGGLTPDVGGAESFTTITAIAPSPLKPGLLWVGTDDGRLHVTRDGGGSWTSVEANLLQAHAPAHAWVTQIRPSRFDPASAFVVLDDHRRGDETPYVLRTDDFGASWRSLATPDLQGHALSLEQDPVDRDLLFLGTSRGLWVSLDGGRSWLPWHHGLPAVAVTDLVVHPRDHDLVIATFGRGVYILDDVRPLREFTPAVLAEPLHLFAIPDSQQHWNRAGTAGRGGLAFHGENRPYGALLTVSAAQGGTAEVQVADASGTVLRNYRWPLDPGLNRDAWGLERNAFKLSPRGAGQPPRPPNPPGPEVPPGLYTVTVKLGDAEAKRTVRILPDPRSRNTEADWQARWAAVLRAGKLQDAAITVVERLLKTRADVETAAARARTDASPALRPALLQAAADLQTKVNALERRFRVGPETPLGVARDELVLEKVWFAVDTLQTSMDPPTPTTLAYLERAEKALEAYLVDLNRFYAEDVAAFRKQIAAAGLELVPAR